MEILVLGLIFVLGLLCTIFVLYMDIFHWEWLLKHRYRKPFVYDAIKNKEDEKGVRIVIGLIAVLAIVIFIQAIFNIILM